jgi:2-polyprenyl-3-methyl-5-hydroxy-6-metoxy-1,4-benzoquinol methylase
MASRPSDCPVGLELATRRPAFYADTPRDGVIGLLSEPLGRVLDIGCGRGAGAPLLRQRGASELVGVELDEEYAASARERYDDVLVGSVEEGIDFPAARFDTVICHDVLEHLYDPWSVVAQLSPILAREGRLHVSLPNARHRKVWLPLVLRGRFAYAPEGLMDVTHLRFFGRRDAIEMVEAGGFEVVRVDRPPSGSPRSKLLERLTGGRWAEFSASHWYLLARPADHPSRA